jgi:uncharacterized membrane protein
MRILIGLLMTLVGSLMYIKGQTETKLLGKPYKEFKYAMGIPIGLIWALYIQSWWGLIPILTYFIACEIGYGDKNPLTKWVGKRNAITIHGTCVGLASIPIIGFWGILLGLISGVSFWVIAELDDRGIFKEPFIAISRAVLGTCLL